MNPKYISAAAVVALLLPFAANALTVDEIQQQIQTLLAQLATLQEQIKVLQSTPTTVPEVVQGACPALSRPLGLGANGSDVLSLQKFLVAQNLLSTEVVTGSFESLTEGAVQRLQTKYGVVLSGTPATTGYGMVGPRTRALIALNCNLPGATSLSCPIAPRPTSDCSTGWQANTDANGCTTSYKCSTPLPSVPITPALVCPVYPQLICADGTIQSRGTDANGCSLGYYCSTTQSSAPTIASVDGPATLKTGERGTWTVRASTPSTQNASLKYSVTWGDEYMAYASSGVSAQAQQSIATSGAFAHAYSFVGTFSPRFTVSNDSGSASFTTSVQISGDGFLGCPIYAQTMQAEMRLACPAGQHWEAGKPTYDSRGCMIPGYGKCVPDVPAGSTFSASPTSGSAPLAVVFSSNVGGGITPYRVDYTIDYGDGVREAAANCYAPSDYCISPGKNTHTYTNTGTYTATLTMTKYNNCQATGDSVCAAWVSSTGTLGTVTITVGGSSGTPTISLSAPSAGTSIAIGNGLNISWASQSAPADSEVRLALLNTKGQYVSNGIADKLSSSGAYQWTVPSFVINTDIGMALQPGTYQIKALLLPKDACVVMHPGGGCRPGTTQRDPYAVTSSGMFSITASAGGVKCKEDLTALDAYNASQPSGTACGQGGPSLRCPYDSSVVYGSLNTCATGFLQQRGWVSVSSSGNTNTNLANALSALEALLKKFLGQ